MPVSEHNDEQGKAPRKFPEPCEYSGKVPGVLAAEPMDGKGGWFVFWQTANAYGARGAGLTKEAAEALAARLLSGEEQP